MPGRRDPVLRTRKHREHNRRFWQSRRLPCARCGRPIDYDGPKTLPNGQPSPRYLVVGHIVSRVEAELRGWSAERTNDVTNTQPECWQCSITSGGEESVEARRRRSSPPTPVSAAPEAAYWYPRLAACASTSLCGGGFLAPAGAEIDGR
jgi:hypothetical protein